MDAPSKDHIYASTDELLANRLRELRWPQPPPGFRERSLQQYKDWLNTQQGHNRWRD